MSSHIDHRTIEDFGEQWQRFTDNAGFYGSPELFQDMLGPLLNISEIKGRRVLDIGSGTGRIVQMILAVGANHVVAVEPSDAFGVLQTNLQAHKGRVTLLHLKGEDIPASQDIDYAFSIGVLHHIVDPRPVIQAVYRALKPGGKFLFWVYGKEGNQLYLAVIQPLRWITANLPHAAVNALAGVLNILLDVYIWLCRYIRLPLRDYFKNVLQKFSPEKRRLVIYDQLRPAYAKYYSEKEAQKLMAGGGFQQIHITSRHGYSWSVIGTKNSP